MAASFVVLNQSPATQIIGPQQSVDVERVEFVTKPTGIYAQRLVPRTAWADGGAAAWIAPLADAIEGVIAGGLASYATWVQEADPATSLLVDSMAFVVTYDPGDGRPIQEAVATVPLAALTVDTQFGGVLATYFGGGSTALDPQQAIRDVYDALVATAGL